MVDPEGDWIDAVVKAFEKKEIEKMENKNSNPKVKNPPLKPKRKKYLREAFFDRNNNLQDMVNYFQENNIRFEDVCINQTLIVCYNELESDEDFTQRLKTYEDKLAVYNKLINKEPEEKLEEQPKKIIRNRLELWSWWKK